MKIVFNWWYIPIIFFGALFVLYTGLVGYRLVTAQVGAEKTQTGEDGGFWSNISNSMGLNTRRLTGERDGHVNVLLTGVAGGDNTAPDLTDTIMFVSVDTQNHELDMFSIPRDLYVEVPGFGYSKINAAYSMGKNYNVAGGGMSVLEDTVTNVVGQDIDYYVKVDFDGFVQAVDLLGGIEVNVENDIYDYMYPDGYGGYQVFSVQAGRQHMDGETALKYSRSRQTTSDFDRARRQQQVLLGMKEAFLSKSLVEGATILVQMIDVISNHLETDLKIWEWERVVKLVRDWGDDISINNFVFDNTAEGMLMDSSSGEIYTLVPRAGDFSEIHDFVQNQIDTQGIKEKEILTMSIHNGTNRVGLASKAGELVEGDGNIVTELDNWDEDVTESFVKCNKDKMELAEDYFSKWDIVVESSDEVYEDKDCVLVLGDNFEIQE